MVNVQAITTDPQKVNNTTKVIPYTSRKFLLCSPDIPRVLITFQIQRNLYCYKALCDSTRLGLLTDLSRNALGSQCPHDSCSNSRFVNVLYQSLEKSHANTFRTCFCALPPLCESADEEHKERMQQGRNKKYSALTTW